MKCTDGKTFKGNWKNGKLHGKGLMIDSQGNETEVEWDEGMKINTNQMSKPTP